VADHFADRYWSTRYWTARYFQGGEQNPGAMSASLSGAGSIAAILSASEPSQERAKTKVRQAFAAPVVERATAATIERPEQDQVAARVASGGKDAARPQAKTNTRTNRAPVSASRREDGGGKRKARQGGQVKR
jgi:hypothetical protein